MFCYKPGGCSKTLSTSFLHLITTVFKSGSFRPQGIREGCRGGVAGEGVGGGGKVL